MMPALTPALRATLILAILGQLLVVLAAGGLLRAWLAIPLAAVALLAMRPRFDWRWAAGLVPFVILALYPPVAFDETMYHLPFVEALARSGQFQFLPDLRFPIFPELQEALAVPLFQAFGDTATHFLALIEMLLLALVLYEKHGFLAAALCIGSPIVVELGTVTYVEAAMMLFVGAAYVCLDDHPAVAGFLLGTACSVKYLGWYFAAAALLYTIAKKRWRPFVPALAVAVLPMYTVILALGGGNPIFPFLGSTVWAMPAQTPRLLPTLLWDLTFRRAHVNFQPPYSPLFAVGVVIAIVKRHWVAALCLGFFALFTILPQDSRYLMPLIAPVSIVMAGVLPERWRRAAAVIAIAPAFAYAAFRIAKQGPPPVNAEQRAAYIASRVPEYRALQQAHGERVFVCGAERLRYYGGIELGDPHDFDYVLIAKRVCHAKPGGTLVYADAAAELWRTVRRERGSAAPGGGRSSSR